MPTFTVNAITSRRFAEFQRGLDAAFKRSFAAHLLMKRWDGHTLHTSGPGCHGQATFDKGYIRGRVTVSGLAGLMSGRIIGDIERMLREAGCETAMIL